MGEPVLVGFQGEPGAYSEATALEVFNAAGISINPVGYSSFDDVFSALARGETEYAAVPFENTLGGSVHVNYDLLLRYHGQVHIMGEHSLRVRHALLALPGVKMDQIKKAMSHPQALSQCDNYLRAAGISPCAAYDTAGSAKLVKEADMRDTCAIASMHAAKVHGLEVLDFGIEDDANNFTRFLILGRKPCRPPSPAASKTSIVFVPRKDEAGSLFKALSVFAVRDINLSKVESRPHRPGVPWAVAEDDLAHSPQQPTRREQDEAAASQQVQGKGGPAVASFEYAFYVDLLAGTDEDRVQNAIRHLKEISGAVRVLGCYPLGGVYLEPPLEAPGAPAPASSSAQLVTAASRSMPLKVAILGFGTFGQFLAKRWRQRGHTIFAYSRSDYSEVADAMGARYFSDTATLIEAQPDVIVLAVSILSFETVLSKLPTKLFHNALVIDVLSVKAHAKEVMLRLLPPDADVLCTHPMFGPDSGRHSWSGLPCVYDVVRVNDHHRCARALGLFEDEGCQMVKMTCEMHDQLAAGSQFVTHFVGRLLAKLHMTSSPIATKGYKALLELVDNTCRDSFDLFYALYSHNTNSSEQLHQFSCAFEELRSELLNPKVTAAPTSASKISKMVSAMAPSMTVGITDMAIELKRQGAPLIMLSVGEPDFSPAPAVLEAAHSALDKRQTKYTSMPGIFELREAICKDLLQRKGVSYEPGQILCCNGAKQGILQAMMALCDPGDEVLIPTPYWTSYLGIAQIVGAQVSLLQMSADDGYCLQPGALEAAITPKTRMLILCNPSNPTGAVHPTALLEELAAVLRRHPHVLVMSDEIYEQISYGEPVPCFAGFEGMYERTVVINGFSKGAAMTGFRLGYLAAPLAITKACAKVQGNNTSCPCSISQWAGLAALEGVGEDFMTDAVANFKVKRDYVLERLHAMPGVTCPTPSGAFYVFPTISTLFGKTTPQGAVLSNAIEVCEYLLRDCHIALVPGEAFGAPECLRISYATSIEALTEAMDRMQRGIEALS